MALDEVGDGRHRLEAAMGGAPEPTREERPGRSGIAVLPEGTEALLEHPRPPHLEVFPLQGSEDQALLRRQVREPAQPQVPGAREPFVPGALERAVFAASHVIDGLMQVLHDVELVEHDLDVHPG